MKETGLLAPLLGLVAWTIVMWGWVLASRLPLIRRAASGQGQIAGTPERPVWPPEVARVSDNYNHLHEQPTLFYAVTLAGHALGVTGGAALTLAWLYVGLRVAHSLVQATKNVVPIRFVLFLLSSLCLFGLFGIVASAAR